MNNLIGRLRDEARAIRESWSDTPVVARFAHYQQHDFDRAALLEEAATRIEQLTASEPPMSPEQLKRAIVRAMYEMECG